MHTTRCYLFTWCAILAVGAAQLSAQPGGAPPANAEAIGGRPLPGVTQGSPIVSGPSNGGPGYGYSHPGANYAPVQDAYAGGSTYDHTDDPLGLGIFDNQGGRHHLSFFGSVDFLMMYSKATGSPPLVTQSPAGTDFLNAGITPPADVLLGGDNRTFGGELRLGGRAMLGHWWDTQNWVGSMLRFTMIDNHDRTYNFAGAAGAPILGVPFVATNSAVNPQPFVPAANLISFADNFGSIDGDVNVHYAAQFYTGDALMRVMMVESPCRRLDLIAGYQYARIDSSIGIQSQRLINPGADVITTEELFSAWNEFHGGSVGFTTDCRRGRWAFTTLAKIAYGCMWQRVLIDGQGTINGVPFEGGLLTRDSNIGLYHRNMGTVAPEVNLNLTCNLSSHLSLSVGYSYLYFSKVQNAGDAIDSVIDFAFPGPGTRPTFGFHDNDFWVMGANASVNFDF